MKQEQTLDQAQDVISEASETSVIDLMIALAKHKKLLIGLPIAAAVISAGISMALPNSYKANTKLLPPQQSQSGAAALLSQLGGMAGAAASASGIKNPNELYVGMLKSRSVADKLIARFNLKQVYNTDSQEKARRKLEANTSINSGKDGLITIEVEDMNQNLVAPLASAYVNELLQLTKVLAVTEASQRRMFFERQLEQAKDNLASAEMELKGALDTRGVISVDSESRAMLETVGRLRAQVSAKEIQLSSMRAFVTATNPEYRRAEEDLSSLRAELSKLENGRSTDSSETGSHQGKQAGVENIKLLRNVKYYEMLYELLSKQYEVARLDEAKDPSVIQVLDRAIAPERRSSPKRALIVLISTLLTTIVSIVFVLSLEAKNRWLLSPGASERWTELKSNLRFK